MSLRLIASHWSFMAFCICLASHTVLDSTYIGPISYYIFGVNDLQNPWAATGKRAKVGESYMSWLICCHYTPESSLSTIQLEFSFSGWWWNVDWAWRGFVQPSCHLPQPAITHSSPCYRVNKLQTAYLATPCLMKICERHPSVWFWAGRKGNPVLGDDGASAQPGAPSIGMGGGMEREV